MENSFECACVEVRVLFVEIYETVQERVFISMGGLYVVIIWPLNASITDAY
jgi:hypothetical protein